MNRCYRAIRPADGITSKNFNSNFIFHYLVACFVPTVNWTCFLSLRYKTFFFSLLSVKHQLKRLIAWQSTLLVTSYSCTLNSVSNFTPISDHITIAAISFKRECGVSGRCKHHAALVPLQDCSKDVSFWSFKRDNGCYKTTLAGIEAEWTLCLCRVGLFDEAGASLTIYPFHDSLVKRHTITRCRQ